MAEVDQEAERVRQHVAHMLARLRALKDQQRAREKPNPGSDRAVEVNREEDISCRVGGREGPS